MKVLDTEKTISSTLTKHINIFICPACGGNMNIAGNNFKCLSCNNEYQCDSGIPLFFCLNNTEDSKKDVTHAIKSFYEENPFPNYEDLDSPWALREKAQKGIFARLLDDQIPHGAVILEVGCGTGQLSNFLGMSWGRTVFGTDICLNSLKLGNDFRERNQIDNVAFLQMNLFRPVFMPDSFDLVICNGVLHHTSDPFGGFQSISNLVKKGGFIIVGLYNKYGRIPTDIRRFLFQVFGNRFHFFDSRLRDKILSNMRRHIWFMDQYKNPHESKHTIGEVLSWFDRTGFEFTNSIPKCTTFVPFSPDEKLFKANPRGTDLDHFVVQLALLLNAGREGGFFLMIGCKKS